MSFGSLQIKDHWREQQLFTRRLLSAGIITMLLTLFLIARFFFLQIVSYDHFRDLSHGNRVRIEAMPPIRGLIFDRNGVLLAENLPAYQLELVPEQVEDPDQTVRVLAGQGLLDTQDVAEIMQQIRSRRRFDPIALRYRLSDEEVARFAVQRPHFPGVDIRARLARHYPVGPLAVHAVGYVGAIDESDLRRIDSNTYTGTTHIGKIGVEQAFEDRLHGTVGHQQIVVNAQGRSLQTIESTLPSPGSDVFLTLDIRLQKAAEVALSGFRGAAVAIDPRDGSILALASAPAYDPNQFGAGFTRRQFVELSGNVDQPLFNRALLGRYPPGSTIKPILGLAALHYSARQSHDELNCPGFYTLPGDDHRYRCWRKEGHGQVNMISAIEKSCDVYFYDLALELGIDRMHEFMGYFGFGHATGIDIRGEKSGLMPSRDWKRTAFSERSEQVWFPGETLITGIGQGFMLATPLQLANAAAILAARGRHFKPRLIRATRNPLTSQRIDNPPAELPPIPTINPTHWDTIISAMTDVIHSEDGTARGIANGLDYRMAGKTGTVQIFTIGQEDVYDAEVVGERLRHHALFIGFAPVENPEIAIAVVIENAGSGAAAAAPAARAILDAWFGRDPATIAAQYGATTP